MERDALLAEKATWVSTATVPTVAATPDETKLAWEAEKAELVKARDDAQAQLKVGQPPNKPAFLFILPTPPSYRY